MKQKVDMLMCWCLRCIRLLELLEGCRENGDGLMPVERVFERIPQGAASIYEAPVGMK